MPIDKLEGRLADVEQATQRIAVSLEYTQGTLAKLDQVPATLAVATALLERVQRHIDADDKAQAQMAASMATLAEGMAGMKEWRAQQGRRNLLAGGGAGGSAAAGVAIALRLLFGSADPEPPPLPPPSHLTNFHTDHTGK